MSAVENGIVVSPATKFREFLEQNESSLPHLSARLEETHREISGQCTPAFKLPLTHCELSEQCTTKRPVDNCASYLKCTYTREKQLTYDKWPQVRSKKYINFAIIDITKPEADQSIEH